MNAALSEEGEVSHLALTLQFEEGEERESLFRDDDTAIVEQPNQIMNEEDLVAQDIPRTKAPF